MLRMKAKGKRQKAKVASGVVSIRLANAVWLRLLTHKLSLFRRVSLFHVTNARATAARHGISIFAFCLLPFAFCLAAQAAAPQKVVDQIIALVNDDIITRSDLLWSLAMDPQAPNPVEGISADLLRQKLDVMIDQRLVAQEARRIPTAEITDEEINKRRADLIRTFKTEAIFRQRVEAVGLTPARIDDLIRERILIDRFVDFRFRSFVFASEPEIQKYYDEKLAPPIRERGQVVPPLDARIKDSEGKEVTVREKINEIIRQDKINQEIDRFLNATRQRADITVLTEP